MEINLGHRGATGDSWRLKSVRNLFADLIAKHPDASEVKLIDMCAERIRDDEEYALAAAQYIVRNALEAREKQARQRSIAIQRPREQPALVASIKEQIMLLNLEMPNGKRLRYCTREEVAKWGKGYERMAKKMKPRQMVGQAFDEAQVKSILA